MNSEWMKNTVVRISISLPKHGCEFVIGYSVLQNLSEQMSVYCLNLFNVTGIVFTTASYLHVNYGIEACLSSLYCTTQVDLLICKYYFACIIQQQTKRICSSSVWCFFLNDIPFYKILDFIKVRCMHVIWIFCQNHHCPQGVNVY